MPQEIEVKFALRDRNELVHRLHEIGASLEFISGATLPGVEVLRV